MKPQNSRLEDSSSIKTAEYTQEDQKNKEGSFFSGLRNQTTCGHSEARSASAPNTKDLFLSKKGLVPFLYFFFLIFSFVFCKISGAKLTTVGTEVVLVEVEMKEAVNWIIEAAGIQ